MGQAAHCNRFPDHIGLSYEIIGLDIPDVWSQKESLRPFQVFLFERFDRDPFTVVG